MKRAFDMIDEVRFSDTCTAPNEGQVCFSLMGVDAVLSARSDQEKLFGFEMWLLPLIVPHLQHTE